MWMLLIPLATFYFLFIIVFKSNKDMLGWCGIAAVIAVNGVIVSYVIMAWNEDIPRGNIPIKGGKTALKVSRSDSRID